VNELDDRAALSLTVNGEMKEDSTTVTHEHCFGPRVLEAGVSTQTE